MKLKVRKKKKEKCLLLISRHHRRNGFVYKFGPCLARLTSLTLLKFSIIQHFIYIDCQVAICLTSIKRKPHIAFIKD